MEDRYARQRKALGEAAHERVRAARVLVVGLGGLGCPAAMALVGAGVRAVTIVDGDRISLSNLHRQPLYTSADVDTAKAAAAALRLHALNADVAVVAHPAFVDSANARELVAGHDVVLDCTDSLDARYAVSDACAAARIPLVQAGLGGGDGQVALLCGPARDAPCYRCLHPAAEQGLTCAQEGIVGPLANAVGSLQALWTIQVLAGSRTAASLLLLDGTTGESRTIAVKRRAACNHHVDKLTVEGDGPACPLPWNAPQTPDVAVHEAAPHLGDYFILDVREPDEHEEFALPDSHLIPLGQVTRRVQELPKDRAILVYCAVGGRSARATEWLRAQGFNATNLRGGVRAWLMAQRA